MKRVFLFLAFLGIAYFTIGQTVENIQVQPDGDKINITYRIGGSTDAQIYNVILTCSMDGGTRFEPRTVIGDVGNNIRGGRPYYTIVWDVCKDGDEVGDAEFFVKVDLVSDLSVPVNTPQEQTREDRAGETSPAYPDFESIESGREEIEWGAYLAYSMSTNSKVGMSFGTLKNFGAYGSFRFGSYIDEWETHIWLTFIAGLTKHIVTAGICRLHAYGGAGVMLEVYEEYIYDTSWNDTYLVLDGGLNNVIGRINVNIGLEYVRYWGVYPVLGLGFAF